MNPQSSSVIERSAHLPEGPTHTTTTSTPQGLEQCDRQYLAASSSPHFPPPVTPTHSSVNSSGNLPSAPPAIVESPRGASPDLVDSDAEQPHTKPKSTRGSKFRKLSQKSYGSSKRKGSQRRDHDSSNAKMRSERKVSKKMPWMERVRRSRYQPRMVLENAGSVARDHLASERTFLAYVRTSMGLASMGVGEHTSDSLSCLDFMLLMAALAFLQRSYSSLRSPKSLCERLVSL